MKKVKKEPKRKPIIKMKPNRYCELHDTKYYSTGSCPACQKNNLKIKKNIANFSKFWS